MRPDGRPQLGERDRRRRRPAQAILGLDQLDSSSQPLVLGLRGVAAVGELDGTLGLGEVGLLAGQLRIELESLLPSSDPATAVGLELLEGRLAVATRHLEAFDLLAHRLEPAGVLGAFGAVAADRVVELALRDRGALARARDRLLEAVGDERLVAVERRELGVPDARGRAEELLARDAGHRRDALGDRVGVADRLAVDRQLRRPLAGRERLHEVARASRRPRSRARPEAARRRPSAGR